MQNVIKSHLPAFGQQGVGAGKSSAGSRLIISVVDQPDPRPVWISVWGGVNCLAQALWDVRATRSQAELDQFVAKLRVYTISDQDDSGRWLRLEFPNLFYIVSPSNTDWQEYHKATWTGISGDRHYRNGPWHKFELVDNPWLREHIMNHHGPLGKLYPEVAYIMEGDTPSFFSLINNGLGSALSPAYGGWGGRYQLYQTYAETHPLWTNALFSRDSVTAENGVAYISDQATIWRWREDFQFDFAARMDWCVADKFEAANHNPVVVLNGNATKDILKMEVKPGQTVNLRAAGTADPDGNALSYHWWIYREAGTFAGEIELATPDRDQTRFIAPQVPKRSEIHIILTVSDNGEPTLTSYRRAIILIKD